MNEFSSVLVGSLDRARTIARFSPSTRQQALSSSHCINRRISVRDSLAHQSSGRDARRRRQL